MVDLLLHNARLVATVDDARRELPGGWVAITDGLIDGVGAQSDPVPPAAETVDVGGCLVTPGLVNAHHHIYQNLTRAVPSMCGKPLFGWLQSLYPMWRGLDEEAVYASAFVGLVELALSGCTTSADHLYVHPHRAGDLLSAEIAAASELGMRFHPTRGSMSLSEKDGGLPPDDVVADDDDILAASEDAVHRHHDRSHGAMVRIALAPCSPFSVTERLMVASAELAERLDVRLHTHFAENREDDEFSLATFGCRPMEYLERTGWCSDRTWVAHCVMPNDDEQRRLGAAGVGVAHCPSSNLILASGIAPIVPMRRYGVKVGIGVDGSSSADSASVWLETRQAMLLAKLRDGAEAGTARMALEMATLGGAGCLGREGEIGVLAPGAVGDVAVWRLEGPLFAGAIADPVEAWLRCGPVGAWHTVVAGKFVVRDGEAVHPDLAGVLRTHATHAARIQGFAT
ncbi:MAG TPA: 8-oxoguanine deaminase [Ilumatobacteraceae bacterium]|nr:8-oxoguanine deaminase [Ilumatobacteraceae bacterium]